MKKMTLRKTLDVSSGLVVLISWICFNLIQYPAQADSSALMNQAKTANSERYQFAVSNGAEISATKDNKAFSIWWQPAITKPTAVIVTLHGHASYATDEFYLWQNYAAKRNFAILALQWWFGGGEAVNDYYAPQDMYPIIADILMAKAIRPGEVLLHGFSRGSANSYAIAALDSFSGNRFFSMVLSNSGSAAADFPPNRQIESGFFGSKPFSGIQWALFCGDKDPEPNINGCPAMKKTQDWIIKYGATIAIFLEDPNSGHGGFHMNPNNVETVLAKFSPINRYADVDKILDWAEKKYSVSLFPSSISQLGYGYYYRCYSGDICVGAKNDELYLYQKGQIQALDSTSNYLSVMLKP